MSNNVTNGAVSWAILGQEALMAMFELRWMLVLIVLLVAADCWFGVCDAKRRGEKVRLSRAGRKTCNKVVDYMTYLLMGCVAGLAVCEPLGICTYMTSSAVAIGLASLFEINSIIGHVCNLHGLTFRLNIKKFIVSLVKKKDEDIAEAIDESVEIKQEK